MPGLVAGGSLLVDYVLTVAVSISSGTAALTSAFPLLLPYSVWIAVAFVFLLAYVNLRGVKESGAVFAGPTFFFICMMLLLIASGIVKTMLGMPITVPPHGVENAASNALGSISLFIILKAFASGCTAMTGVEAIANGVQAFRKPEDTNARRTLVAMAIILLIMFIGISWLAQASGVAPMEGQTVVSQIARAVWGDGPLSAVLYYGLQIGTMAILVLAANTSYADFPRLASFMANDGFLPKQLKDRGSRLVYSNGLFLLTIASIALIVVFKASVSLLIPLYAIGVFASFTLSQSGMVVHWLKCKEQGWRFSIVVNGAGAVVTALVTGIIAFAKFRDGAWLVLIIIPLLIAYFVWVKRHYSRVSVDLSMSDEELMEVNWQSFNPLHNHVILLVNGVDKRLFRAIQYVRSLRADRVEALFVDIGGDRAEELKREWDLAGLGIRLTVVPSPYRELTAPIRDYIRTIPRPTNDHVVTVILPEFVPDNLAEYALHDQTSLILKQTLFAEPGVIVTDVPFHLGTDDIVGAEGQGEQQFDPWGGVPSRKVTADRPVAES
jgi:amino acid transporter